MGILGRAFAKRVLILGVLGEVASLFGLTAMEKAAHYQGLLSLLKEVGIIALFFSSFSSPSAWRASSSGGTRRWAAGWSTRRTRAPWASG